MITPDYESPIADILAHSAELAEDKYQEYGNTYMKTGRIMHELFHDKSIQLVGPVSFALYSVLTWIVGKLCRFATAKTHEARLDSLRDLVVYAAMAYSIYKGEPHDED